MRIFMKLKLSFFLFVIAVNALFGQSYNVGRKGVAIENELYIKKIYCGSDRGYPVAVEYIDKKSSRKMNDPYGKPFFEFVLSHQLITSFDSLWQFKAIKERAMANKGTEYTLVFSGVIEPVKGLLVLLKQQAFPGSPVIREKLIIKTEEG